MGYRFSTGFYVLHIDKLRRNENIDFFITLPSFDMCFDFFPSYNYNALDILWILYNWMYKYIAVGY